MTKDRGPVAASGCFYIGGSLLLFFGIAITCNFAGDPQRWRVGVSILAVCAIPLAIIIFRLTRVRRALGRAELHLDLPMKPGSKAVATFVRPLRSAALEAVDVRLTCESEVTKRFGRIWIPTKSVLFEQTITPTVTPVAEKIEIRIPVEIPATGIRSSSSRATTVTWWLRLRLHMKGCPDTTSSFVIDVV